MKSGLYACAGASATASAAACAKRFDEPITNRSNVYFGLMPGAARAAARRLDERPRPAVASRSTESWIRRCRPVASRTTARISSTKWPSIHSRVKSFGTVHDERVVGELDAPRLAEPGAEGLLVERLLEPTGDLVPEALGGQLDGGLHAGVSTPLGGAKRRA